MATRAAPTPSFRSGPGYGEDYAAWIEQQLLLLRERRVEEIDYENLIDEVGDLGSNVWDKYVSAIELVLLHMLKWDYQPERRGRSWRNTIDTQRDRLLDVLAQNPSFKSRRELALARAYRDARRGASSETDMPLKIFPETCPYDWTAITTREHPLPGGDA